jgi:nitrogen-specific signal transduction histidine kinase
MKPLITEKGCLKCHAKQGYKEGDIRGGISVAIPMSPLMIFERSQLLTNIFAHGLLWFVGLVGLGLGGRFVNKQINDLKLFKSQFEESERKYQSMMDAIDDLVYICSEDYRVEFMNPAMIKRIGIEAIGSHCYEAINDLNNKCPWCPHVAVQKGYYIENEVVSPKDNQTYIVSHSPISHEDGSISKMTIYKNISHIKQLQAHLIQSERLAATGQLASSIAHEINSPLQAITSTLSLMKDDCHENKTLLDSIDLLKGAFSSIRSTVKSMLDLNRPKQQKKQPIDINEIIKETVTLLSPQFKRNNVKATLELSSKLPAITASPQKLNQVFLNLCNNAMEAMIGELELNPKKCKSAANQTIKIKSNLRKQSVIIKVIDEGPGISETDLKKVFDPFYTKKKKKGLGVGLSICHDIITDHNGIIIAGNSPGGGAVFTIKIPINNIIEQEK